MPAKASAKSAWEVSFLALARHKNMSARLHAGLVLRARNANRNRGRGDGQRQDQTDRGKRLHEQVRTAHNRPVTAAAGREACRYLRLAGNIKVLHGVLQIWLRAATGVP